jgi:hypothetical protein
MNRLALRCCAYPYLKVNVSGFDVLDLLMGI